MQKRELGKSGIQVQPLMLGGNVFGWTADEATSFRLLDAFVDGGGDFIDTADMYSRWAPGHTGGESETIIGKWFQRSGRRSQVILATKLGKEMGPGLHGLVPSYIKRAVEDSLRRLQTDHIDLYQAHEDDPHTPLTDTLSAFGDLIKEGKVRAVGASNYTGPRLREALEVSQAEGLPRYQSLQPLYNLYDRTAFEQELAPVCQEFGLGVVPYYSLAAGFLTGKYRSPEDTKDKPRARMVQKYTNERGWRIVKEVVAIAQELQTQPASVALAWLMAQPVITAPIASATSLDQMDALLASLRLTLSSEMLARLDQASR